MNRPAPRRATAAFSRPSTTPASPPPSPSTTPAAETTRPWRAPDRAWWWHVPVCAATLWIYGRTVILKKLGLLKGPADRKNWQGG